MIRHNKVLLVGHDPDAAQPLNDPGSHMAGGSVHRQGDRLIAQAKVVDLEAVEPWRQPWSRKADFIMSRVEGEPEAGLEQGVWCCRRPGLR